MDSTKDYYATLGVLPTAEDVVIRAAYRALAQRYHPDRNSASREEATRRMAEINEAYDVLSDPANRSKYDSARATAGSSKESYTADDQTTDEGFADPANADWEVAVGFFPDLESLYSRLKKISSRLAFTFKAVMLESKAFDKRQDVATKMERDFLHLYFGDSEKVIEFACWVIDKGNKEAARELNNVVRVIGKSIPPERIIAKIRQKYFPNDHAKHSQHDWVRFRLAICDADRDAIQRIAEEFPEIVKHAESNGDGPLHIAVDERRLSAFACLVELGADLAHRNLNGETPAEMAKRMGRDSIIEYLENLKQTRFR